MDLYHTFTLLRIPLLPSKPDNEEHNHNIERNGYGGDTEQWELELKHFINMLW